MGTELRLPGVPALGDARGTRGSLFRDSKRVPRPAALGLAGRLPGAPPLLGRGRRPSCFYGSCINKVSGEKSPRFLVSSMKPYPSSRLSACKDSKGSTPMVREKVGHQPNVSFPQATGHIIV